MIELNKPKIQLNLIYLLF